MSVTPFSKYGPIVTRGDVEKKTLQHVEDWFITYLADVERDKHLPPRTLPQPRTFSVANEFQRYPEDTMPHIVVISPGLAPGIRPRREGDGLVTAWWAVGVGAVVSARADTPSLSKDLAGYYGAALRLLMSQIPDLGGFASGTEWLDERYDDFPRIQERTIAACRLVFNVEVQEVMDLKNAPWEFGQPLTPPEDPYAQPVADPVVADTEINIQKEG